MAIDNTTFLHFNDVYSIEKSPPFVASVKRTKERLRSEKRNAVTVFGGDSFSPSIMSTVLRGEQMIPVLNAIGIDAACLGNHDLDFGMQEFRDLKERCNFPWICSNAFDRGEDKPLGGCHEYVVVDKREEGGPKILIVGLVEQAWMDTLSSVDPSDIVFEQPVDFLKRRIPELSQDLGPFDIVVAAAHMRMPNNIAVAKEAGGLLDIILGGHDHHYEYRVENGIPILNSGVDFKMYSIVDVQGRAGDSLQLEVASTKVDINKDDAPDDEVLKVVQAFKDEVYQCMDQVVGRTKVRLDARFSEIRTKETNTANFLAELLTRSTGADIALFNAGTIRADRFIEKGDITVKDLCELLPIIDQHMVVEVTAERIILALENGVSGYPSFDGRFPCIDGLRFSFDPSKTPGSRVVRDSVYVRDRKMVRKRETVMRGKHLDFKIIPSIGDLNIDEGAPDGYSPLDSNRTYSLVSHAYLIAGKDGFDKAFVGAPVLRDEDECPPMATVLRNVFTELRMIENYKGLVTNEPCEVDVTNKSGRRYARRTAMDPFAINPKVDGRINNLAESKTEAK